MRTIILTGDARGDRPIGTWLRDIGFKLVEMGCEINIMRADGAVAQELLADRGMEVVQVVDAYAAANHLGHLRQPARAGAKAYPEKRDEHQQPMQS